MLAVLAALLLALSACGSGSSISGSGNHTGSSYAPTVPDAQADVSGPLQVTGLGDSVMKGTNCGCAGIVSEYAAALAAKDHVKVDGTNLGDNGLVTTDVLNDLRDDSAAQKAVAGADVVLVTIGANDLTPQLREYRNNGSCDAACYSGPISDMGDHLAAVLAAIRNLRSHSMNTVLVTDYWNVFLDGDVARKVGGQAELDWSSRITGAANNTICKVAREAGATCVDLLTPFKGDDGTKDPTDLLAADGDHPNAAGVKLIVQALLAATPAKFD